MKKYIWISLFLFPILACWACSGDDEKETSKTDPDVEEITDMAKVTNVTVNGEPGSYTFAVEVSSPDTGCDQYADWWEVVTPDGELIYRRILAHSHVGEQPFTRSGGKVPIQPEDPVLVRVHMNNSGYSKKIYSGNVADGFIAAEAVLDADEVLEKTEPLPNGCGG